MYKTAINPKNDQNLLLGKKFLILKDRRNYEEVNFEESVDAK